MRKRRGGNKAASSPTTGKDGVVRWLTPLGQLHRENGPSVEYPDGSKEWWVNGLLHRIGAPAIEKANGTRCWCVNGLTHRIGGPAVQEYSGRYHREEWWEDGRMHREDGPSSDDYQGTECSRTWFLEDQMLDDDGILDLLYDTGILALDKTIIRDPIFQRQVSEKAIVLFFKKFLATRVDRSMILARLLAAADSRIRGILFQVISG